MKRETLIIYFDKEDKEYLKKQSDLEGIPMGAIVRRVMKAYLRRIKDRKGIDYDGFIE